MYLSNRLHCAWEMLLLHVIEKTQKYNTEQTMPGPWVHTVWFLSQGIQKRQKLVSNIEVTPSWQLSDLILRIFLSISWSSAGFKWVFLLWEFFALYT